MDTRKRLAAQSEVTMKKSNPNIIRKKSDNIQSQGSAQVAESPKEKAEVVIPPIDSDGGRMKVYVVSEKTTIDLRVIKDGLFGDVSHNGSVVEMISNPVADDNGVIIKVEPEDDHDDEEEEVLLYDGDPVSQKTDSVSASVQYPFKNNQSFQNPSSNRFPTLETKVIRDNANDSNQEELKRYPIFIEKPVVAKQDPDIKPDNYIVNPQCPLTPATGFSSIVNFVPVPPSSMTEFNLKFINQTDSEPLLKVKHQHPLQLGDRPISRSFDIIVRRKNYKSFPIQWIDAEGQPYCPFLITSAGTVTYGPISVPKGGDVIHHGASVTVENAEEIMISFSMVSTYLTRDEREKLHIRMHTAKQLELLCLDQQDGSLLGSVGFQVVCEPRPGQKRKKAPGPSPQQPTENGPEPKRSSSDSEDDRVPPRKALIQELQEVIPRLSNKKLGLLVSLAKALAEK